MKRSEFEQVIAEQYPRLVKIAGNLVGKHAATDVVQTTLAAVFEGGQWKHDVEDIKKWLTTAVQNHAKNYLRSEERRLEHEATYAESRPLPLDEISLAERADVQIAVEALPEEIRAAVVAVLVNGETEREHAEAVGVSQPVVHKRVQQGRELLERVLSSGPSAVSQEASGDDEEVA